MNTWIKLEKSLDTDPRVLRIARRLSCNAGALHGVTLVCGALARLWMFADSHARADDTLDMGFAEIDDYLGVPGFCAALPADWIVEIDENRVELPGFQAHNNIEARRRALGQKRVAAHRERVKRESVTPRNAGALPDQDQDQDQDLDLDQKKDKKPMSDATSAPDREVVERIFAHWQTVHRHPTAKLDEKRRKVIRTALKAYTEADLCEAIAGYANSPHHMGENDRATRYDAIELFLRDAKHVDAGIAFARNPPRTDLSKLTRGNIARTADWTPPELRNVG